MTTPAKIIETSLPTVTIVGRVNVGKSTLFNRLVANRQAIVSDIPGTTRTRNIGYSAWRGKQFRIIDTGGLTFTDDVVLEKEIIHQTELALKEADVIIFLADVQQGLLPQEKELAKKIKNCQCPIIFVANKADNLTLRLNIHEPEWKKLGLGEPIPISAQNGSGVGDLMDLIFSFLNKNTKRPKIEKKIDALKVALIGKPNVGKSSLFNKLIGEERVIVSPIAHTTREPHDTLVEINGKKIIFVDTAGIRRKIQVSGELEKIGIGKSLEMVKKADVVLFLLDATEPITDQDQQLGGLLREHAKSTIIIINKWDKAEENDDTFRKEVKLLIQKSFPHLNYAPIVFVSALNGYRVHQIFPLIERAAEERKTEIAPEKLENFLNTILKKKLPGRGKGTRQPKILGLRQINTAPPIFEMFIKSKTSIHYSYVHYVTNRLREQFSFFAAPIIIKLTKMKR
jgi:GTP-binding protein